MTQLPTPPSLTVLADVRVAIGEVLIVGETDHGIREIIPITGGKISGPWLNGEVVPGGADWCLMRRSGIAEVWARYTLRTDDGQFIMVTNAGFAQQSHSGDWIGTTAPRFEVASGSPLGWLMTKTFVGSLRTSAAGDVAAMQWWQVES